MITAGQGAAPTASARKSSQRRRSRVGSAAAFSVALSEASAGRGHRNQRDMVDEANVEKMFGFLFREVALGDEETTIKRFVAHTDNGRLEILAILRALRADLDLFSASQSLDDRKVGWVQHGETACHCLL